ncbi:hypothetical protein ACFS7Z_22280 [Pontibacter toksunensis]|uniref:DUF4369 domain-containing protein n=1 Tax=Pontibacter toksunensis TaxID=1332631 RepID=A0ABW6C140_9BACT
MKLKLSLTSLLLFITISAFSQCSVGVDKADDILVYYSRFERILVKKGIRDNGDLTEGYQTASVRFLVLGKEKKNYVLEVTTDGDGRWLPRVIPRRLTITAANGTSINLNAGNSRVMNGSTLYSFILNSEQREFLKNSITGFQVIDTRTDEKIFTKPVYDKIMAEQIACLENY